MPTQPYYNARGERLPGTTWVIGQNLGWNKDPLMRWANREGLAGRNIRDERGTTVQRAGDIGTAAHAMIEGRIQGRDPEEAAESELFVLGAEDRKKAMQGFHSFERWYRDQRAIIVATELFGVDEEYQTGFCLDALGLSQPDLDLYDWKSSKGTYADHMIQIAAYTVFVEKKLTEWFGGPVRLGGAHVLRVGKDTGTFKHLYWTRDDLEHGWRAFSWLRALHYLRPTIEAYVR